MGDELVRKNGCICFDFNDVDCCSNVILEERPHPRVLVYLPIVGTSAMMTLRKEFANLDDHKDQSLEVKKSCERARTQDRHFPTQSSLCLSSILVFGLLVRRRELAW
jgi:hypothetical protein